MNKCHVVIIVAAAFFVIACSTVTPVDDSVDYTDDKSIQQEVIRTRSLVATEPLNALYRSLLLVQRTAGVEQVQELFTFTLEHNQQLFRDAVQEGRWSEALVLFRSLQVLNQSPEDWSEEKLRVARVSAWKQQGNQTLATLDSILPSTPDDEAPSPQTVARMIQGTVTVWVDRGIRFEGGVGFADRVIGSAFFIDDRGYLITNYHVIASEVDTTYNRFSRLYLRLPNDPGGRVPARVVGWDPVLDLALLKTELKPQVVFPLGSSRELAVGSRIYAIGSPAGLDQTLTSGIVSAKNRRLLSLGDVMQIDAPINHGSSGGPIVDEAGRVQAVVFAGIEAYEGLNFAIPVELLRVILPALYEGGMVSHPWLASLGQNVPGDGAGMPSGVRVVYSIPGTPMALAGIPQDAVITAINGRTITTLEELQHQLMRELPGTLIRLEGVWRPDPASSPVRDSWIVQLNKRPRSPALAILERDTEHRALLPLFGLELEAIGRKRYSVKSVVRGSVADNTGFSEQDYIELRQFTVDEKEMGAVLVQLFTKRRRSGYLEAFIAMGAALDSPSFF